MYIILVYKKVQKVQKGKGNGKNSNDTRKTYAGNKEKAEAILKELGISISAAYEMFYRQIIAHHGIPFDLRLPNKNTLQAMKDARDGKGKDTIVWIKCLKT